MKRILLLTLIALSTVCSGQVKYFRMQNITTDTLFYFYANAGKYSDVSTPPSNVMWKDSVINFEFYSKKLNDSTYHVLTTFHKNGKVEIYSDTLYAYCELHRFWTGTYLTRLLSRDINKNVSFTIGSEKPFMFGTVFFLSMDNYNDYPYYKYWLFENKPKNLKPF